jgi:hypothetical protein
MKKIIIFLSCFISVSQLLVMADEAALSPGSGGQSPRGQGSGGQSPRGQGQNPPGSSKKKHKQKNKAGDMAQGKKTQSQQVQGQKSQGQGQKPQGPGQNPQGQQVQGQKPQGQGQTPDGLAEGGEGPPQKSKAQLKAERRVIQVTVLYCYMLLRTKYTTLDVKMLMK